MVRRLQDKELMTLRDDGVCLSMHQPWASFLVKGIKKHEGRTWYSAHRGDYAIDWINRFDAFLRLSTIQLLWYVRLLEALLNLCRQR